jgi:hypothetical protein
MKGKRKMWQCARGNSTADYLRFIQILSALMQRCYPTESELDCTR